MKLLAMNFIKTIVGIVFLSQASFLVAGNVTEENQEKAEKLNQLGVNFDKGKGVKKDFTKAYQYYLKAAELGLDKAQHNVAQMYFYGDGVTKNINKAIFWYEKAVAQDYADAQYTLGRIYNGSGSPDIKINGTKAFYLFKKASEQGHADAQYWLSLAYLKGWGTEIDTAQSLKWIKASAKQDNKEAIAFIEKYNENLKLERAKPKSKLHLLGGTTTKAANAKNVPPVKASTKPKVKTITRDELKNKVMGKTRQEVISILGRPESTQEATYTITWYYENITHDEFSGKTDSITQIAFDINDKRVESVSSF